MFMKAKKPYKLKELWMQKPLCFCVYVFFLYQILNLVFYFEKSFNLLFLFVSLVPHTFIF